MLSTSKIMSALATSLLLAGSLVDAKAVFCHYMVSGMSDSGDEATQDVTQAAALGFDGFALNVGKITDDNDYIHETTKKLFDAVAGTDFKLFFSVDTFADGTIGDFTDLINTYITNANYYTAGPNNDPFLSTFGYGTNDAAAFTTFKSSLSHEVYFVPNFDNDPNYSSNTGAFLDTWGSVIDGAFSWEAAWPWQADTPTNVTTTLDETVMSAVQAIGKTYMMPLSTLQYKHLAASEYGAAQHWYRAGEVVLPQRMTDILSLDAKPDFVEVISWNDAGESHYMGNVWPEGPSAEQLAYSSQDSWDHSGWQSLYKSFNTAYKAGSPATAMVPSTGAAEGAMWYRTILKDATCGSDPLGKPEGWGGAQDSVNWAVVVAADATGYNIRVSSGGNVIQTIPVSTGLNYGAVPGMATGAQKVELVDASGSAVMTADSKIDVASDTDGICNFNYQVVALAT